MCAACKNSCLLASKAVVPAVHGQRCDTGMNHRTALANWENTFVNFYSCRTFLTIVFILYDKSADGCCTCTSGINPSPFTVITAVFLVRA